MQLGRSGPLRNFRPGADPFVAEEQRDIGRLDRQLTPCGERSASATSRWSAPGPLFPYFHRVRATATCTHRSGVGFDRSAVAGHHSLSPGQFSLDAVYSIRPGVGGPSADLVTRPGPCGPTANASQPAR